VSYVRISVSDTYIGHSYVSKTPEQEFKGTCLFSLEGALLASLAV